MTKPIVHIVVRNQKRMYLEHTSLKRIKVCPLGFSWTSFLFGGIVPLYRGAWKIGFVASLIQIIDLVLGYFIDPLISITSTLLIAFIYGLMINQYCVEYFLKEGYLPMTDEDSQILRYL